MQQGMGQWEVISSACTADGAEGVTVYGVRLTTADGVWEWRDVDVSHSAVERLLERLRREQPQRCHWEDIVRDFIVEQSLEQKKSLH